MVTYADEANAIYKPTNTLEWAPDRAVTADWGVEKLAGFRAPKTDMDGQPRKQGICAGAYEAAFTAPRPADGTFTVTSDDGLKSAGLYDVQSGHNVKFLFSLLPLHKGRYAWWLPSRDWQGRAIPPGRYELRVAEADLRLRYLASVGNGVHDPGQSETYSCNHTQLVVFDSQDPPRALSQLE